MPRLSEIRDINGCARCHGLGHVQLPFYYLTYPIKIGRGRWATEYATCPKTKEPILLEYRPRTVAMRLRRRLTGWRPT